MEKNPFKEHAELHFKAFWVRESKWWLQNLSIVYLSTGTVWTLKNCTQLFWQRLSLKGTKVYKIPIGMSSGWGSGCVSNKEREAWMHVFVLLRSFLLKPLQLWSKQWLTTITQNIHSIFTMRKVIYRLLWVWGSAWHPFGPLELLYNLHLN